MARLSDRIVGNPLNIPPNFNAIINGDFDIWQRGTSQTAAGYGSADRWTVGLVGSGVTFNQQTFTLGQTAVPDNPVYYSKASVGSIAGAGNYALIEQRIEGVQTFAGTTATLSFWAKADANKNIAIEFTQSFGTGGTNPAPSANVLGIGVTTVALTTSWVKHTVPVALPSISGKTLGTNGNDYLWLFLWMDAGSDWNARANSLGQQSGTFEFSQVQIEAGSVATTFEPRSKGEELALCQRYYWQKSTFIATVGAYRTATVLENCQVYFPVSMRAVPTCALPSLSGNIYVNGSSTAITGGAAGGTGLNAVSINLNSASKPVNAAAWASASSPITANAEL